MILLEDCKLIRLESDGKEDDFHFHKITHYEIRLITNKGSFVISGCGTCEAIFFDKEI